MSDRQFVYPGQIPQDTDILLTNKNAYMGLAKLSELAVGRSTLYRGLSVGPNTPAALNVVVAKGEIYSYQNVDNMAYGSVPADTTDQIVKQGIQLGSVVLSCPAPSTTGFSINYLIEATFAEVDTNLTVLPYYNASNPSQAWNGPNNNGTQQATVRANQVSVQAKAGVPATTGSQTTPALDAGYVALAVVTVANGQSTITAGNIVAQTAALIPNDLLHLIQQDGANYAVDTGAANAYAVAYTPAITALTDGMPLSFRAVHANTGASTLNVNGMGNQSLVSSAHNALVGGEILAGSIVTAVWNANAAIFELQSGQQSGRLLNVQIFTASGTYTPTPGTNSVIVEVQGGGGGGGGAGATSSSQFAVAGGGASGAYAKSRLTSGFAGLTVTVGAAGSGGSAGNNIGNSGGTSSFGALISCGGGTGGVGGIPTAAGSTSIAQVTGVAATATGGNILNAVGRCDTLGIGTAAGANVSGSGCASIFGGGGRGTVGTSASGVAASSYGSGGGGACANTSAAAAAGGNGAAGIVIVHEYA